MHGDRIMHDGDVVLSVIVAMRNVEQYLSHQLDSVASQTCRVPWEVVIADNGSSDRSVEIAESYRDKLPALTIVDASARRGPGAARNAGVNAARGTRLVFCDADDELAPGTLDAMAEALAMHRLVAARLDHRKLNEPWSLGIHTPRPGLLETNPAFLPYTFGTSMGVQRELHHELGGFDPTVELACEDRDYCYRAQLAGAELVLVPDALVHYRHRETWAGCFRQWRNYAIGSVHMYERYRSHGLDKPPAGRALLGWGMTLLALLPSLRSSQERMKWAARLGWRVGRAQGSWRYRVWAP